MSNERGIVLGIMMVMAMVATTAAFAVMAVGLSRLSIVQKSYDRAQAQYVAEAGLVWAMQQLWVNASFCPHDQNETILGRTVRVTCGGAPPTSISATVVGY